MPDHIDYSPRKVDVTDLGLIEAAQTLLGLGEQADSGGNRLIDPACSEEERVQAHARVWAATGEALALLERFGQDQQELLINAAMGVITLQLCELAHDAAAHHPLAVVDNS